MTGEELIDQMLNEAEARGLFVASKADPETANGKANPVGGARAFAQGLSFATADEAEAYMRSIFSSREYDDILEEVRTALDDYRKESPAGALSAEITGAAVPAVLSMIFSGGTSTPAVVAASAKSGKLAPWLLGTLKAGGLGAVEGGAYAFNAGERGFQNRASGVPVGMALGATGGVVGYNAARGAASGFEKLMRYAQTKFGQRVASTVEREFRQIADDAGLTVDDIVKGIEEGRFPAEMGNNKTLAQVARGYRDQSRAAGSILEDAYQGRTTQLRTQLLDQLRTELSQTSDPNVIKAITAKMDDLQAQESTAYNNVFGNAAPLGDDVVDTMKDAISRSPQAGRQAQAIYRAETGKNPFWKIDNKTGEVIFDRPPTLQEAEIIRRGLKDVTDQAYSNSSGALGTSLKGVEQNVRGALDEFSPDLKGTRQNWANIMGARDAFEKGRKALSRQPDEVAILMEKFADKPEQLDAFRAGVAAAYRGKSFTGAGRSLPRNLADDTRSEGAILRLVFPEDKLDDLLKTADVANGAMDAEGVILGCSQTSTNQARNRQSNAGLLAQTAEDISTQGVMMTGIRAISDAIKSAKPSLTDSQVQQLAKLMVETDPAAFSAAMQGGPTAQAVTNFVTPRLEKLVPAVTATTRRGAAIFNPRSNVAAEYVARGLLEDGRQ